MKALFCSVAVGIAALAANGYAQDLKPPPQAEVTKATYLVSGLHCAHCVMTVEGSLKKVKGVKSVTVNFQGKYATIEFDETVVSAQEVASAMSATPHMMGKDMRYGGILVLSVPGVREETAGKKAEAALGKVAGVAKVTLYPQQQAVGIRFTDTSKVTSKQLIEALEPAGLKGNQYATASGPSSQAMNGQSGPMANHAGMAMGNGGMAGSGAMGGMGCGCMPGMQMMSPGMVQPYNSFPTPRVYYGSRAAIRGGCCR